MVETKKLEPQLWLCVQVIGRKKRKKGSKIGCIPLIKGEVSGHTQGMVEELLIQKGFTKQPPKEVNRLITESNENRNLSTEKTNPFCVFSVAERTLSLVDNEKYTSSMINIHQHIASNSLFLVIAFSLCWFSLFL